MADGGLGDILVGLRKPLCLEALAHERAHHPDARELFALLEQVQADQGSFVILADISEMGTIDAATRRCAEQAMELLPAGSAEWYLSAGHILVTSGRLRTWDTVERWLATVLAAEPAPEAQAALALCLGGDGRAHLGEERLVRGDEAVMVAEFAAVV